MSDKIRTAGICTLGCRVNQYESEAIAEALSAEGFEIRDFSQICDVYIINSCAVTEESVRKSRQMARRARKLNPDAFVAVCGCAAQLDPETLAKAAEADYVCGTRNKASIVEAVKKGIRKTEVVLPCGEFEPLHISSFNRTRAYIKIQDGCNGNCSYCVIPKVRGTSVSRRPEDILDEVGRLADKGIKEVVFTGIETSDYRFGLPELIEETSKLTQISRIRLSSVDPSALTPAFVDAIFSNEKFMPHLHVSLQSGSDRILKLMRRRYNARMARTNLEYIRRRVPEVHFSADMIVGFPTETEEDFKDTMSFADGIGLLHGHVFSYSKRPGTEAALMDGQIPEEIKAERSARLISSCDNRKEAILKGIADEGKPVPVLVEKYKDGIAQGHTPFFAETRFSVQNAALCRGDTVLMMPDGVFDGVLTGYVYTENKK